MRAARWLIVLAAAALLSGCSATRIAYGNAELFLRWQANSYFDFSGEQSEELEARIAAFLAWHRARALPQYARLAEEAGRRLARGLAREDLVWGYDSADAQVREALRVAAAKAGGLLDRIEPEQITHLERRFAEDNRKFAREQLAADGGERHRRRLKRNLERLEDWFGPLTDEQVERVRRYSEGVSAGYDEMRDRDRRRIQSEFVGILRARETGKRLGDWAPRWDRGRDPAYAAAVQAHRGEFFGMLLDLDRSFSAAQRERGLKRLRELAADFEALAGQP